MAGLVVGIRVRQKNSGTASPAATKTLHLFVNAGKSPGLAKVGMGYVLQQGTERPAVDSVVLPGTVIVTNQDVATDVVITNHLAEATAVHWHGLELESYSDGVAGWSGSAEHLAPVIEPGDSFVAHLTLKRPGTFIYHTHMDDMRQMTSGLYGALVVLPPGKQLDPATDRVWVVGTDGLDNEKSRVVVNGDSTGPVLQLRAGVPQRMRFVNMGFALGGFFGIYRDKTFVPWRAIAKDGADLPASQAVPQTGPQLIVSGETYDFEWIPAPGRYQLRFGGKKQASFTQVLVVR
jgi:FtsP/CotA-like multicopper oxidase with cupredoxin domain